MSTLIFANPGEIDIRGATIAGLSAKAESTAIGYFGTGLKYSIACILRWGGSVSIYSGLARYDFAAEDLEFRGKGFKQVVMHSYDTQPGTESIRPQQALGFTTEYGKNWSPWQVFRELYANARDEGGDVMAYASGAGWAPASNQTTIVVSGLPDLYAQYPLRDQIILPTDAVWSAATEHLTISDKPSEHLYFKGVRVAEGLNCVCTYNMLTDVTLTEDRTLDSNGLYAFDAAIDRFVVSHCSDESLIFRIIEAAHNKAHFERRLDFGVWQKPSDAFLAVAERLWVQDSKKYGKLHSMIAKHKPQLMEPKPLTLSPFRQRMLDRAIQIVTKMDVDPSIASAIHVAELGESILGRYNRATGIVWLNPILFDQGTKAVVSCLYEELVHAHTGKADCTYNLQTYLFNRIISLYEEHVIGEPI